MADEIRLQSFQRGSPTGRILQIEALYHPDSNQHIVFWDDILEAFPGATSVLNGNVVVSRARDAAFRFIEPRCIKYQGEKVLEVVGGEDLGSLGGSTFALTPPAAGQLTFKNIEQWAAMTMPEDTLIGGMYAPTICTLTTNTTRPFKPLMVRTETDASSVSDGSDKKSEDEEGKDKENQDSILEGYQEKTDELEELINELANSQSNIDTQKGKTKNGPPLISSDHPPSPPLPGTNLHNVAFERRPLPPTSDTNTMSNSSVFPLSDSNNFLADLYDGHNSTKRNISGGPISPTSLSSISTAYTSPTQQQPPTPPPASTKSNKPGFLKSALSRLTRKTPIQPRSPQSIVETEEGELPLPYYYHPPLLGPDTQDNASTYQSQPYIDASIGYSNGAQPLPPLQQAIGPFPYIPALHPQWQWKWENGRWCTYPYGDDTNFLVKEEVKEEDVDYDKLFRQVEADRVRKWQTPMKLYGGAETATKPIKEPEVTEMPAISYVPKTKYQP